MCLVCIRQLHRLGPRNGTIIFVTLVITQPNCDTDTAPRGRIQTDDGGSDICKDSDNKSLDISQTIS